MKISKKIIISSLSTALGVSMVGAISGTVAWYQYNTAVRTSLIGTNVANTGILEISATSATSGFKSNLVTSDYSFADDRANTNLEPVTFYDSDSYDADDALPTNAYKRPDAAKNANATVPGSFGEVYKAANGKDYIRYDIYVRARTVNDVATGLQQTAEKVYLKDFVLEDVGTGLLVEGLRVHLSIDEDGDGTPEANMLLSKDGGATALSGNLDLDGDGVADKVGGYEWNANFGNTVTYGASGKTQNSLAFATALTTYAPGETELFTTPSSGATKITVTIWMEGWAQLYKVATPSVDVGETLPADTYYTKSGSTYTVASGTRSGETTYYEKSAVWSGENTDGKQFRFGMTLAVDEDTFLVD